VASADTLAIPCGFAGDESPAQALRDLLGLFEHVLCSYRQMGPSTAAGMVGPWAHATQRDRHARQPALARRA